MAALSIQTIAESMYEFLEDAEGKRNVSPNDLTKAMIAELGADCTREDCKKAIRLLIESQKCVYCFQGGVNYIRVAPKQAAAGA